MKGATKTKTTDRKKALANASIHLVDDSKFKGKVNTAYRDVLTFCFENLNQAVEWPRDQVLPLPEARRIQNGFHSSGMGRMLRATHNVITAVVPSGGGYKIQIRVEKKSEQELAAESMKKTLAQAHERNNGRPKRKVKRK